MIDQPCKCRPCPECGYKHFCNLVVPHKWKVRIGGCPPRKS